MDNFQLVHVRKKKKLLFVLYILLLIASIHILQLCQHLYSSSSKSEHNETLCYHLMPLALSLSFSLSPLCFKQSLPGKRDINYTFETR